MKSNWLIDILPVLIVVLIVLAAIIAIIVHVVRKQKIKNMLLREQGFLEKGAKGNGDYEGIEYSYYHFQGGKNAPPYFKVSVDCPGGGSFKITRENRFDRFFKKLGICVELDTRDQEFDDNFFITTDTVGFAREYFSKPEKRRAVMDIFAKGFSQVLYEGKKQELTATWNSYPRGRDMEIKTVEEIALSLGQLSREVPNIYEQDIIEIAALKQKRFFSAAVPIFLLIAGIIGMIFGFSVYRPLDEGKAVLNSLQYSIPLLILFLFVSVNLLRGRSSSHRELIGIWVLSIFAFILGGIGGEITLNGWLDKGKPMVHEVDVINKYTSRSKNNTTYHVVVKSWRKSEYSEKLMVNANLYDELEAGQSKMIITTKPGKFGFEWLVDYQ